MSNYLAIAAVTATLRQILENKIKKNVNNITVSILPPDHPKLKNDLPKLNLFLYQVTQSATWQSVDLPTRRSDGSLMIQPQLGLDLHYLLTVYGNAEENDIEVHRILGNALQTLHEHPVLTRSDITAILKDSLEKSNLADQVEMVKLTAQPLSLEEFSKLWSVFFQTPYRISIAYQASVVLIEGRESPSPSLPVRERGLYVVQLRKPFIEQVISQDGANKPIVLNSTLVIRGYNLHGEITQVRIVDILENVPTEDIADTRIVLKIPQLPDVFRAGVQGIQVIHQIKMGKPPVEHYGSKSNLAAFVLCPKIKKEGDEYQITVSDVQKENGTYSATISIEIEPKVGKDQRVALLLSDKKTGLPEYTFVSESRDNDLFEIEMTIHDVQPGEYLAIVQIDNAESPLDIDNDGNYIGPKVTIP